jgi:hypothetical protein
VFYTAHILAHTLFIFRASFLPRKQTSIQATTGLVSVALACCNPDSCRSRCCAAAPAESEDMAQKTVFETVVGCCSPSRLERAWYAKMRSKYFSRKTFAACLGLVVVVDILLPLLVTGKTSFGEAKVFHPPF